MCSPEDTHFCNTCTMPSTEAHPLKRCAKCKTQWYCSRECQKIDWKDHKQICSKNASETAQASAPPRPSNSNQNEAKFPEPLNGPKKLSVQIAQPFHELDNGKWLHNRPKEDVYKLLIDSYRLRMEDDFTFTGTPLRTSIYGLATDGREGFTRYLRRMEKGYRRVLLPPWWTREHSKACVEFGMQDGWYSLSAKVDKFKITQYYQEATMPMEMRLFAEFAYGRGPGGQSAIRILRIMKRKEFSGPREA